jgi:hypothetical protein
VLLSRSAGLIFRRSSQHLRDCHYGAVHVFIGRSPIANAHPHDTMTIPVAAGKKRFSSGSNRCNRVVGPFRMIRFNGARFWIYEAHQTLIDCWLTKDLGTRQSADSHDK